MTEKSHRLRYPVRVLCVVLAVFLFAGILVSCGEKTPGPNSGTTKPGTQTTVPDGEGTTADPVTPGFDPESAPTPYAEDFGGYEFRVLSRSVTSTYWAGNDICGDATGNVLDKEVFNRNEVVGKKYNFFVTESQVDDWVETARNTAMAGGKDTFDMWSFKMNDMPSLAQEGFVWDLTDVSYMRLDAAYYDQSLREMASFDHHEFFLTGDLVYMDEMATECVVFNPDIWTKFGLENTFNKSIYEIVDDGEWTIETFREMARLTTFDRNGDDTMDSYNDDWGFCWENSNILGLNIGMGNALLTKDENDIFVLEVSEKQINDLEKIIDLFNAGYSVGRDWTEDVFEQGNQFFTIRGVKYLSDYTGAGLNFGVLPFFKSSEEQQEYRSFISTYGSNCITICTTVEDENKVASIIELLSYQSRKNVSPALNNYLFGGRILQHQDDVRMLQIIFSNRVYELCYLWSTGSLYTTMITLNDSSATGIKGTIDSCKGAVEASVARKLERLQNLA